MLVYCCLAPHLIYSAPEDSLVRSCYIPRKGKTAQLTYNTETVCLPPDSYKPDSYVSPDSYAFLVTFINLQIVTIFRYHFLTLDLIFFFLVLFYTFIFS